MKSLSVSAPVRLKLGDAAADGLTDMFADAHALATESFERRLGDELAKMRLEIAATLANLRSDVLKWSFLFWIGQLAAMTAILNLMLPR
jgi:hypothetical protein